MGALDPGSPQEGCARVLGPLVEAAYRVVVAVSDAAGRLRRWLSGG